MNVSLYEHLDEVCNMYVEERMADIQHTTPPSVKSHMTFTKTDTGANQSGKGLVLGHKGAQKGVKASSGTQRTPTDWSSQTCNVFRKNHPEAYFNCPKLDSLQQKQGKLVSSCCDKCVFSKNSAGVCPRPHRPCHFLPTSNPKVKVNLLSLDHATMHFKLCTQCPPVQVQ